MKTSIPSSLLKLNLRPLEFRLLCHFYVWGKCIHAIPTLAEECLAIEEAVCKAIRQLVKAGLITKTFRFRETSEFTYNGFRDSEESREDQICTPVGTVQAEEVRSDPPQKPRILGKSESTNGYDPRKDPKNDYSWLR